jgi:hypothetical protein
MFTLSLGLKKKKKKKERREVRERWRERGILYSLAAC